MKPCESGQKKLEAARRAIDRINLKICSLLNRRARLAVQIGLVKKRLGAPIFDPVREKDIINYITRQNRGPFSGAAMARIFQSIMRETRTLENHKKS